MSTLIIRVTAVLAIVLCFIMGDSIAKTIDNEMPLGAQSSFIISVEESSLPKEKIIHDIDKIMTDQHATLLKVSADPQDFFHHISLYVFGENTLPLGESIPWYDSSKYGDYRAARDIGALSLNGKYLLRGGSTAAQQLRNYFQDSNIRYSHKSFHGHQILAATLLENGYGVTLLCMISLSGIALMGWSASRIRTRQILMMNGRPFRSLLRQDISESAHATVLPACITILGAAILVLALRGAERLPRLVPHVLLLLTIYTVALVCLLSLISLYSQPALNTLARRKNSTASYKGMSVISQCIILCCVALSLPVLYTNSVQSMNESTKQSYWSAFSSFYSVRIGGSSDSQYFSYFEKDSNPIAHLEKNNHAILNYSFISNDDSGNFLQGSPYDGLVLTNTKYLDHLKERYGFTYQESSRELSAYQSIIDTYSFQHKDHQNIGFSAYTVNTSEHDFPALAPTSESLLLLKNPIIIVTDSISENMSPSFMGAALSSGNILSDSPDEFSTAMVEAGMGDIVLAIDRAADAHLTYSSYERERMLAYLIGIVILFCALIMSTIISAFISLTDRARNDFILRTAGLPLHTTHRSYWITHLVLATGCGLLAYLVALILHLPNPSTACTVPLIYLAVLVPSVVYAHRSIFKATISRRIS